MLATVGLAVLRFSAASPDVGRRLLETAADLDDAAFRSGVPLFTILVRAFLVRDVRDMAQVRLQVARAEKAKVAKQQELLESERQRLLERLSAKEQEMRAKEEEIQRQEEAV